MANVSDVVVRRPSETEEAKCRQWPTWGCEASEFPWEYDECETCLILEGKVTVTDNPEGSESVSFGAGDYVIFPHGFKCIWKVSEAVRKHYKFG